MQSERCRLLGKARADSGGAKFADDLSVRRYLAANVDLVDQVDAPGSALDLDTPDELASWLEVRSSTTGVRLTPGEGVTSRESE